MLIYFLTAPSNNNPEIILNASTAMFNNLKYNNVILGEVVWRS